MLKEYHKIETLFKRSMEGNRELVEGKYRNPAVEFLANNAWKWTEKIDGTNIRIYWDGHKVTYYGRTDRAQIPGRLNIYLKDTFCTNEAEELFEQLFGEKEVTLYGEGYGSGIQKGGAYRADQSFIMFDVMIDGRWLLYDDVAEIAKAFDVDVVPVIMTGTINEAVAYVKQNPMSTIGTAPMEGIVGRPMEEFFDRFGNRMIVKVKACDFK